MLFPFNLRLRLFVAEAAGFWATCDVFDFEFTALAGFGWVGITDGWLLNSCEVLRR